MKDATSRWPRPRRSCLSSEPTRRRRFWSYRNRWVGGRWESSQVHNYLTSQKRSARELAQVERDHWQIENDLNWTLDVFFAEDQNRTRNKDAAENVAWIRREDLFLFKQAPADKQVRSLKGKRRQAMWSDDYLLEVLQGIPEEAQESPRI